MQINEDRMNLEKYTLYKQSPDFGFYHGLK